MSLQYVNNPGDVSLHALTLKHKMVVISQLSNVRWVHLREIGSSLAILEESLWDELLKYPVPIANP